MENKEAFWIPKNRIHGTSSMSCSECGGIVYGKSAVEIINEFKVCPHCGLKIATIPFAKVCV